MDADRPAEPPQGPEDESQDSQEDLGGVMTLREHLQELRTRLTIAVLAVIVASLIVWPFKDFVFEVVQYPLPRGAILQQISPTETLFTFFMISIIAGLGIASPIVLYQVLAYVAPGLYEHEKRWLYLSIPAIAVAFLIGAAFAWFVVLRFTVGFLAGFAPRSIATEFTVATWVTFVLRILLAVGIAFETPFFIFALAKIGVVKASTLGKYRRYAIVAIVILAAVITPTPDPFTQLSVAVPVYALYEIGVVLARVAAPEDDEPEEVDGPAGAEPAVSV